MRSHPTVNLDYLLCGGGFTRLFAVNLILLVKPAPTDHCRGGFHQPSLSETNNFINPPPPKNKSDRACPNSRRGGFHQPSLSETNNFINPPPPKNKSDRVCPNSRRGGFHQPSMSETNNIINPPPPND